MSSEHDHKTHHRTEAKSPDLNERTTSDEQPEVEQQPEERTEDSVQSTAVVEGERSGSTSPDTNQHNSSDVKQDTPEPREQDLENRRNDDGQAEDTADNRHVQKRVSDNPEDFDSRSFLSSVSDLQAKLQADRYTNIDENFQADELTGMVDSVKSTMNEFKRYAMHTQQELEKVREQMRDIKGRMYKHIQAKGYDPKSAQEKKSFEERELEAKLAQLNKEVAKAAEELVRASQVTLDTETAATEASLVAEQAAAEAKRIQEEYEARKRAEIEARKAEEERREAERRQREEEERRQEELRRAEEAKKAKLRKQEENKPPDWENWPVFTYNSENGGEFTQGIGCVIRANPDNFKENMVAIELVDPLEKKSLLGDYEELVSDIIKLCPAHGDEELQKSIYIAIPHCTSRTSAISREPVIKAEVEEGKWEELKTQEITLENKKDMKFVQAEVNMFTSYCVVTRFKRDFLYLTKRGGKIASNVDARVTFSVNRGAFKKTENFILQLQQVDSGTVNRIKERSLEASKLLTCSAIVNMEWASETFTQPVYMTLPCPPNPVKAKKAAAARAAKEAKMKNPQAPPAMSEAEASPRKREKKKTKPAGQAKQQNNDDEEERPNTATITKWYMGQYGNDEDDENDLLYFLKKLPNNKWMVIEDMNIQQVKLDLLQLRLDEPIPTFMVLRTRTTAGVQDAQNLAETIETCLKERVVGVVLRQKMENQCEVILAVVLISRLEKVLNQFDDEGYEPGVIANNQEQKEAAIKILNEGDVLEVKFTGNIKCQDPNAKLQFVFHSQMNSQLKFPIIEVDRYLQKVYSEYRGFVQVIKKWEVVHVPTKKEESEGELESWVEVKRELISKHMVKVPKEEDNSPRPLLKAPVKIRSDDYSLDDATLRRVAQSLGDEWLRVAHYLNVKKQRIQAILRNNIHGDEEDAKYDMLLTWIKKVPRRVNKTEILIGALTYANRPDLANELREQEREFQMRKRGEMGRTRSIRSAPGPRSASTRSNSTYSVRDH